MGAPLNHIDWGVFLNVLTGAVLARDKHLHLNGVLVDILVDDFGDNPFSHESLVVEDNQTQLPPGGLHKSPGDECQHGQHEQVSINPTQVEAEPVPRSEAEHPKDGVENRNETNQCQYAGENTGKNCEGLEQVRLEPEHLLAWHLTAVRIGQFRRLALRCSVHS